MIAVVIVTYNGAKWITKSVGYLLKSTVPLQIFVIDNGSTDGTQNIIKKNYSEVNFYQSEVNLGFGKANNIGIKKAYNAGADFVFLLNQDAWVKKDTVEKLITIAQKHSEYGVVSPLHLNGKGDALDVNFSHNISPAKCSNLYSDTFLNKIKDDLYEAKFVNAAAWLISRKCIETVGGFNPLFHMYGEDDNYIHRMHYHGFKVGIYPYARIFHDRENRKPNIVVEENEKNIEKRMLVKYSNPNELGKIEKEIVWAKKGIVKAFLKANKKQLRIECRRLSIINRLKKEVEMYKNISMQKGMTFLT